MTDECAQCGKEVPDDNFVRFVEKDNDLLFCTPNCAFAYWLAHKREDPEEQESPAEEDPTCRICGIEIEEGEVYCPVHRRQKQEWERS